MEIALVKFVRQRALDRCEYCLIPQSCDESTHEIDHVIALKHDGDTVESNLALACFHCNNQKGPNLAGIDPVTDRMAPLFHPRRQKWDRHFLWRGVILVGRTATGRATVQVLMINHPRRLRIRKALMAEGLFPPADF